MRTQRQREAAAILRLRSELVRLTLKTAGYEGAHETVEGATVQLPGSDVMDIVLSRALETLGEIHTNNRGKITVGPDAGTSLDGDLDGWSWQAWCGRVIAYGATEDQAKEHLRRKMRQK